MANGRVRSIALTGGILGVVVGYLGPWWGAAFMAIIAASLAKWIEKASAAQEASSALSRRAIHRKEKPDTDGHMEIDWDLQMVEIRNAWADGDYEFARTWLRKFAYYITANEAPPEVHDKFKQLTAEFAKEDPLYSRVMTATLPVIKAQPGVVQSQLAKQFPQFTPEDFRYAMYYAEIIGHVEREKKGSSYALTAPDEALVSN